MADFYETHAEITWYWFYKF